MSSKKKCYELRYRAGKLPDNIAEILSSADETELKVLTAVLMLADEKGEVDAELLSKKPFGFDPSEVDGTLKFWRGTGLLAKVRENTLEDGKTKESEKEQEGDKAPIADAHKDGVIESADVLSGYRTKELADLLEKRTVTAEFIDAAQRAWGKAFTPYEVAIAVAVVDQVGVREEVALAIMTYCVRLEKRSMKYFEKTALRFYDEGINTVAQVQKLIREIDESKPAINKVRRLFGAADREMTSNEKKFFTKWVREYGFDIEVIRLAYDITVDVTREASPNYANGILSNWHKVGLRTPEEVNEYLVKEKEKREMKKEKAERSGKPLPSGDHRKSYDNQEFFDAALRRCMEKIKS